MKLTNPYTDKKQEKVSGLTVLRYKDPINEKAAQVMTQFIFDHKRQASVLPNNRPTDLIESTNGKRSSSNVHMCMNHTGQSAALGPAYRVELGGAPDMPGFANRTSSNRVKGGRK
jgi:hypothetical protein